MRRVSDVMAILLGLALLIGVGGCGDGKVEQAQKQVRAKVDVLDEQRTDSGTYVRKHGDEEKDPWGRQLLVRFYRSGITEYVEVRSAGPDGHFHGQDDIVSTSSVRNFSGIGSGIKDKVGEAAKEATKGIIRGLR